MSFSTLNRRAKKFGATDFGIATAKDKKFYVIYNNRKINFGAKGMSDYTIHHDKDRRDRYRARASKITNKYGEYTYLDKNSPNFWSYHLLW